MVKLSFITLLAVVSLGALFMLALLWVHGSPRYNDGKDIHYHPKKFYDVYEQKDPSTIQKNRVFAPKKEVTPNSSVHLATEKPMTFAEEYPPRNMDDEDGKSKAEGGKVEVNADLATDNLDNKIEVEEPEVKLPEPVAVIEDYSNLSESAKVPEDVKSAVQGEPTELIEEPVAQSPPLVAEPVQLMAAPTEPPLPPLYHNTFIVTPENDAPLFGALHAAHVSSIQHQVDKARKLAALIYPVASDSILSATSFEFHALERLHRALKTGASCVAPLAIIAELDDPSVYTSIQSLLANTDESFNQGLPYRPRSIVEYTKSSDTPGLTVSAALAGLYPTITVLQLQFGNDNNLNEPDARNNNNRNVLNRKNSVCPMERAGSNVYIASGESNVLDHTPLMLDCVQIVPDLDLLVGNLLPFELEDLLGNILCRCNVTYVPNVLPNNAYFAFWESTAHLLHSAALVIPSTCALSFDSNSAVKFVSTVKSSHIVVQRNITNTASPASENAGSASNSWSSSSSSSYRSSNAYSSEAKAVAVGPTAEQVAKTFLTVQMLSRLSLDARSRHHLWSSVLTYLASTPGEAYQQIDNATMQELLVQGSSVRSAADVVTKAPRKSFLSGHEERAVPLLQQQQQQAASGVVRSSVSQRSVMNSAESAPIAPVETYPTVEVPSSATAVVADANFTLASAAIAVPNLSAVNLTADSNVASTLSTMANATSGDAAPSRRRKLYDVVRRGATGSSTSTTNRHSSTSTSSTGSTQPDKFEEESQTLTWEFPDRAASIQSGTDEFDEIDYVIKNQLHLQVNSAGGDSSVPSGRVNSQYGRKYTVSKESRGLQRHLHLREDDTFHKWIAVLKMPMAASGDSQTRSGLSIIAESGLVYVMGRHISLLSLKLAKMLSTKARILPGGVQTSGAGGGLLVSLLSDSLSFRSHSILNQMMDLKNNVACRPVWSPATLAALLVSPERASLSLVQVDVVVEVIVGALYTTPADAQALLLSAPVNVETECKALLLEESIAALLSMAEVSLIEVPSSELLQVLSAESGLPHACVEALAQRYISGAQLLEYSMQQLHLGASVEISELPTSTDPFVQVKNQVKMFRVDMQRLPSTSEDTQATKGYKFVNKASHVGFSVYTALQLGIVDAQKKTLLKMLIDFPLWKFKPSMEISPWDLFIRLTASSPKRGRSSWSLFYSASEQHARPNKDASGIDAVSRNHMHYTTDLRSDHSDDLSVGVSVRAGSAQSDRVQGRAVWKALEYELSVHRAELAEGRFSFVEHDSGFGYVSLRIAKAFPNATVISLERSAPKVAHHVSMVKSLYADNNAVCLKAEPDATIFRNIYESPELFRFQLQSRSMLDGFIDAESLTEWGSMVGTMLSAALTTFVYAPSSAQVSWAMHVLFSEVYDFQRAEGTVAAHFRRYSLHAPVRALSDMFGSSVERPNADIEPVLELNKLSHHPQYPYRDFEKQWVLENARVNGGNTAIQLSPLAARDKLSDTSKDAQLGGYSIPLVRCDIVNMTRHVHHHYDYAKDGHSRTYTMRVKVNQTLSDLVMGHIGDPSQALAAASEHGIVLNTASHSSMYALEHQLSASEEGAAVDNGGLLLPLGYHPNQHSIVGVHLFRDRDTFPIPYTHIYGVTLISALRLGLEHSLRDRLFKHFLKMPLYEDMAPWNIVLMGPIVDYIDYDTRDVTFNKVIPQAYQVMTVLMNYKRTVEDFKRCGSKSSTVYGLPYVSDCVGSNVDRSLSCPDLKLPVPCADGACHSDYISCLRSITNQAEELQAQQQARSESADLALSSQVDAHNTAVVDSNLIAAMKSIVGQFNDRTVSSRSYEDFVREV